MTGVASLFGVHFTSRPIRNYRDVVTGDADMTKAVFLGLLNEGILLQTSCAGSLGVMTTEAEIDDARLTRLRASSPASAREHQQVELPPFHALTSRFHA